MSGARCHSITRENIMPSDRLNMPRLSSTITKEDAELLENEARRLRMKISAVVRLCIEEYRQSLAREILNASGNE